MIDSYATITERLNQGHLLRVSTREGWAQDIAIVTDKGVSRDNWDYVIFDTGKEYITRGLAEDTLEVIDEKPGPVVGVTLKFLTLKGDNDVSARQGR